jgi:predicted O-methyltransferase YrrM
MISKETLNYAHSRTVGMSMHYLMLYACVFGLDAKRVYEFGAGFSSKVILEALEETNGSLISCDPRSDEYLSGIEQVRWTHVKMESRNALKLLKKEDVFDLVFHDGTHRWKEVKRDLEKIMPHIKKNGLILIHDTDNSGKKYDLYKALEIVQNEKVTLCYGSGLTIIRKAK